MTQKEIDLKKKGKFLLYLKKINDDRYLEFCIRVMLKTGRSMNFIENKIVEYSMIVDKPK